MSTIVFDGTTIAVNLGCNLTDSSHSLSEMPKIYKPKEGETWWLHNRLVLAYVILEVEKIQDPIIDLFKAGVVDSTPVDLELDYGIVAVTETHECFAVNIVKSKVTGRLKISVIPYAKLFSAGTGDSLGYLALGMGKTAVETFDVITKHDVETFGTVDTFVLPPKPEKPTVREVPVVTTENK